MIDLNKLWNNENKVPGLQQTFKLGVSDVPIHLRGGSRDKAVFQLGIGLFALCTSVATFGLVKNLIFNTGKKQ
ncbi:mitochondrial Complex IV (CIV) cytochrome c:O2 oxidoreductase subunit 7a (Cox7a/Cox9) [Andalucia godoyi]|uniref:Mitochondrial Complex IV (CIV) cytochrome c:O2 oxidoreductase subunit 7a (Cox7a/Cox9) n=1 Tax=Andalucia godoyi TaxID=505711 RepID=A0A8K0AI33_ANDGO|nr:mitochondrial Complex IV (CIV) cytochrome c:O2 oxidoreductase subunit 7a (Cox7a/Cox9) [Andalucia godoyi]|eukprot:ANDGO_08052.mRNA.1 mitochondrial Complex IV (CIV) cytochrome c:O2 oxidoreductase subunit 7a (Cox7a/Cox9)